MPNPRPVPTITPEDVTLRDIVEQGYDLVFQCSGCLKVSRMDVLELVHKFGPEPPPWQALCGIQADNGCPPAWRCYKPFRTIQSEEKN